MINVLIGHTLYSAGQSIGGIRGLASGDAGKGDEQRRRTNRG